MISGVGSTGIQLYKDMRGRECFPDSFIDLATFQMLSIY